MDEPRRVLLEVGPRDADRHRALGRVERQATVRRQREVVLADLVTLRQIGVEVVLAVPARRRRDRRLDRETRRQDVLDGPSVDDRQRTRQPQADRADVGVRWRAVEVRRTGTEHLAGRPGPAVDLDPDDRLIPGEDRGGLRMRSRRRHGATEPAWIR